MTIGIGHKRNLETLIRAAKDGSLALLECTEIATGQLRAVICAVNRMPDGSIGMVPFGHMSSDNPYEDYLPPEGADA